MFRRLRASADFLNFNPKPNTKPREDGRCRTTTVEHERCGHFTRDIRVCPVSESEGNAGFNVCEPQAIEYRYNVCGLCEELMRDEMVSEDSIDGLRDAAEQRSRRYEPPAESPQPDDDIRESIMSEIEGLCKALNFAVKEPGKGSCIHEALINHVCNTPVAAWSGFTVCKLLKKSFLKKKQRCSRASIVPSLLTDLGSGACEG